MTRILAVVATILAIAAAVLWFGVLPARRAVLDELVTAYSSQRTEYGRMLGGLGFEGQSVQQLIQDFDSRIPDRMTIPELVSEVFVRGDRSDIDVLSVSYAFEKKKDIGLTRVTLAITADGSYRDIRRFVHLLERPERYNAIGNIRLARRQDGGVQASVTTSTLLKEGK